MSSHMASEGLVMKMMIRTRTMMPIKPPLIGGTAAPARRALLARRRVGLARDVADEGGDGRVDGFVGPPGPEAGHEDVR